MINIDTLDDDKTDLLLHHRIIMEEVRLRYGFEYVHELKTIVSKKNVQIAFLTNKMRPWELLCMKKYQEEVLLEKYAKVLVDTIKEHYLPRIEEFYGSTIVHYRYFSPRQFNGNGYTLSLKVFDKPLFKEANSCPKEEEAIAGQVARYIRGQMGRGPEKTSATILNNRFMVILMSGLVPPYMRDHGLKNPQAREIIKEVFISVSQDAIDQVWQQESGETIEKFIDINLRENLITAITIMEPINSNDF